MVTSTPLYDITTAINTHDRLLESHTRSAGKASVRSGQRTGVRQGYRTGLRTSRVVRGSHPDRRTSALPVSTGTPQWWRRQAFQGARLLRIAHRPRRSDCIPNGDVYRNRAPMLHAAHTTRSRRLGVGLAACRRAVTAPAQVPLGHHTGADTQQMPGKAS
jgi:hypothetical protein